MNRSLGLAPRLPLFVCTLSALLLLARVGDAAPPPGVPAGKWITDDKAIVGAPSRLLVYSTEPRSDGGENRLILGLNGRNLELVDAESGAVVRKQAFARTTAIYIRGADGETKDTLVVDFTSGTFDLPGGIHFDGGTGGYDTLDLHGGSFARQHFEAINSTDGIFHFDQLRVAFTNLEPINDTVAAATFIYNGTNANETITIVNGPVVSGFQTTSITNSASETVNFARKTSVTINAGAGIDNVTINNPLPATGLVNLTVDGGGNVDGLNAVGDALTVGVIPLAGGTVSLRGFLRMTDNNAGTLNITASSLALRLVSAAATGGDAGSSADPLEVAVGTVAFNGLNNSGGFFLSNNGSITINSVDSITSSVCGNIDVATTNGGAITVAHNTTVSGTIQLTATDAAAAGQNITINTGVTLTASNGDIIIQAGDNFTLNSGAAMNVGHSPSTVSVDFGNADSGTGATATLSGSIATFATWSINGGADNDTINLNNLGSARATLAGGGGNDTYNVALAGITAGAGIDVFDAAASGTDTLNLTGSTFSDTFTVGPSSNPAAVAITRTSAGGNSPAVSFDPTGTEAVNVNGAASGDTYVFNAASVAHTLTIADNGASGSDTVTLNGTTGNDTLNASGTQIVRGSEVANFSGIEAVTVNGNNGSDTFNITPSASIPMTVAGGNPAPPTSPGDTLIVNISGTTNPVRSDAASAVGFAGSYSFANRQPVNYSQIETRDTTPACNLACSDITVSAPPNSCGAVVTYGDSVSNCGTVNYSPVSGSMFPMGTTTVTATSSLGTTCSFNVTVQDNQAPTVNCPAPVTVANTPGQCGAVVTYSVSATDNCPGGVTTTLNPPSGSTLPVGTTQVTATATDAAGKTASCIFPVTVNDTEKPAITCPGNITVQAPVGANSAPVTFNVAGTDNCSGVSVQSSHASGSQFPVGTTTITSTATDAKGNAVSCSFNVTVEPPISNRTVLGNISTRLRVETGLNVLIGGFIITGDGDKKFIARGVGPSLGIEGALANPKLELYNSEGGLVAENDNWQDSPNKQAIIDSTIPPAHELEPAIVETLAPAAYTAIVSGVDGGTGIGLVEVYDLDRTVPSKFANISTRGLVQTGADVMIGGTIIVGEQPQKVIIRAIGPSLPGVSGNLQDPVLELFDGEGNPIAQNDNWRDTQQDEVNATGIPPSDDRESAIVRTLPPAAYTAIVRGASETTGVALIEVYALSP